MSIYDKVLSFIRAPDAPAFEALALDVSITSSIMYRLPGICLGRGAEPRNVRSVAEIPPVSTVAFKYAGWRAGKMRHRARR